MVVGLVCGRTDLVTISNPEGGWPASLKPRAGPTARRPPTIPFGGETFTDNGGDSPFYDPLGALIPPGLGCDLSGCDFRRVRTHPQPQLFPGLTYAAFLIRVFVYAKSSDTIAATKAVRVMYGDTLPAKVAYIGCVANEVAPITPAKAEEQTLEETIKQATKMYARKFAPGVNIILGAKTAVDVASAAVNCASGL